MPLQVSIQLNGAVLDTAEGDWGGQAGMFQVDCTTSSTGI